MAHKKLSYSEWSKKYGTSAEGWVSMVLMTAGSPPPAADPDADFKAEYATDRAALMRVGITEAEYVQSRRATTLHGGQVSMLGTFPDENAAVEEALQDDVHPYGVGSRYSLAGSAP